MEKRANMHLGAITNAGRAKSNKKKNIYLTENQRESEKLFPYAISRDGSMNIYTTEAPFVCFAFACLFFVLFLLPILAPGAFPDLISASRYI